MTRDPQPPASEPELTFPGEVREYLRGAYEKAQVILEYGSGGSTLLAARLGKRVTSVESDPAWARMMRASLAAAELEDRARIVHVDIGPVGDWGRPLGPEAFARFHRYPLAVWDREDFAHPDLILIDGRLRVACLVTAALRITRPVTILFDDYVDRRKYHKVERLVKPVETVGRMARFELTPGLDMSDHWSWAIGAYSEIALAAPLPPRDASA
ncbi:hypothetical protein [Thioclava atlantica]|uniref:Putative O-linked N-acetylglucosamine transferase, SPINDLY family protein n=1 Tax=Thioclava atlantica TaxID=1317124 RepID=A0A085TTH9_9RHOB|nr:hypothetical protein [Thioclava atlantica]KFE34026.1 putative O-linked N-acetylglucosamine transferase, SPINDLY family protein [Thioclava atlantica]